MEFGLRLTGTFVFALFLFGATSVQAQGPTSPSLGDLSVTAGRVDYDLSGTGHTSGLAIRWGRDLTSNVSFEVRGLFARPCQQFQSCQDVGPATLFVPEAQLQYRWKAARLEPFVGAGLGFSALRSSFHTNMDPTVVFSAGTGVRLTDRLALTGEVRLRGHEFRFVGTSSEVNAGLSWRLPAF
jgi:hypothetical protein